MANVEVSVSDLIVKKSARDKDLRLKKELKPQRSGLRARRLVRS